MSADIHATAIVDPSARIADSVRIGAYAIIEADAHIAAGTKIWPHAFVCEHARIAENCEIHMGAIVGHLPQDLTYEPCVSYCRVGAGTVIREGATLHRGTTPDSVTEIGEGCYLMGDCHIAHNCTLGAGVIVGHGAGLGGYVEVGEKTFVGGHAAVHQFCRIGRMAMLSGYLSLSQDVPPFHRAVGVNRLNGLNSVGLKRAGVSREARRAIKEASRILFRSDLPLEDACAQVEAELEAPEARELAAFCRESKRGIARMDRSPKAADA